MDECENNNNTRYDYRLSKKQQEKLIRLYKLNNK